VPDEEQCCLLPWLQKKLELVIAELQRANERLTADKLTPTIKVRSAGQCKRQIAYELSTSEVINL
jgi:hypothetical protein